MSKNKVEEQDIIDQIAKVEYHILPDTTTTIGVIHLKNGWTSTGISACVDPANFNKEVGEEWAYKDAFKKLWPLFGFLLRQRLHDESTHTAEPDTFLTRLAAERDRTVEDLNKLNAFLAGEASAKLDHEALSDLKHQSDVMTRLAFILSKRYDDLTVQKVAE